MLVSLACAVYVFFRMCYVLFAATDLLVALATRRSLRSMRVVLLRATVWLGLSTFHGGIEHLYLHRYQYIYAYISYLCETQVFGHFCGQLLHGRGQEAFVFIWVAFLLTNRSKGVLGAMGRSKQVRTQQSTASGTGHLLRYGVFVGRNISAIMYLP